MISKFYKLIYIFHTKSLQLLQSLQSFSISKTMPVNKIIFHRFSYFSITAKVQSMQAYLQGGNSTN